MRFQLKICDIFPHYYYVLTFFIVLYTPTWVRKLFVMHKMIITLLLSFSCILANAQTDWHLKRDEDGIKVYTAATPNSDFKSIKVECTVNARLSQLIAFLLDVDKQPDWVYNSKHTQLLKKIAPNEFVFYSEVSVPWPCTNRDYIAHLLITQVSPQLLTIDSHTEPNLLPEKDGIVRIKNSVAHWEITSINATTQKIVYTVRFDPAGAIPAWLTNMFVAKGPFETFQKLRTNVSNPAYQNAHVDFLKEQ